MVRALARIVKVPGSNPGLDDFHSVGKKVFNFDLKLQRKENYISKILHQMILEGLHKV